jgi:uncharacterized protein YjhX (UPF0386 family)
MRLRKAGDKQVPARSSHIPHNIERTALQNVASGGWFPAGKLLPAQKKTIAKMMVKGWIERQSGGPLYRITADGLAALKAPIPESRHLR